MEKYRYTLNLQMFAEDNKNDKDKNDDKGSSDGTKNTDKTVPYDRFTEINNKYKEAQTKLDTLLKEQQDKDTETKKKQGEFQALYDNLNKEHEPLKQEHQKYKETFKTLLEIKLKTVPDEFKDLIPKGSELEQLQWIETAASKGIFGKKENLDSFGNQGNNPPNDKNKPKKGFLDDIKRKF